MSLLLDDDTILLEHLDHPVPCVVDSAHVATFYISCRHCDLNDGFLCDTCLARHRELSKRALFISCMKCRHFTNDFDLLFKVVPL